METFSEIGIDARKSKSSIGNHIITSITGLTNINIFYFKKLLRYSYLIIHVPMTMFLTLFNTTTLRNLHGSFR